ncbi:MAG: enolase C-terminal domain-like protein [Verrucomicrobiota bacterium]|nr:mandelate racemase/muconate lactonizing enzyme family protein [Verrucomicrobiota bacterium]MCC6822032.1 mandelate racemase/muconate lactonizing enzyme family protein [Limisphaerales bacterium]
MSKPTDIRVIGTAVYFLPVRTRVPLKFGTETLTEVLCARVRVRVTDRRGQTAEGWGETPLSVQWVWPSTLPLAQRNEALKTFCFAIARSWAGFAGQGHPMEIGHDFQEQALPELLAQTNAARGRDVEPMPWLAALVGCSAFDLAVHDAFGHILQRPVYSTYGPEFMSRDLGAFLESSPTASFAGKFPQDFLVANPPSQLPAWHLVGGLDLLDRSELKGDEPDDGYPVLLPDWIQRDGLQCLKVKLRGADARWDFERMVKVGDVAIRHGVKCLSADFNCTVTDPAYVIEILERLQREHAQGFERLLYVEQPFPYDLEQHQIDVSKLAAIKPLFLDESAHNWRVVRLGRELGWTGVALKTCKTQTGALLTACWAKAHGMQLMVQDLTNPMLAQIPHVLLAAQVGTIMGVETNAMQFYPAASAAEAVVHPGLYQRRNGVVALASVCGPGFGYRVGEIARALPRPAGVFGSI